MASGRGSWGAWRDALLKVEVAHQALLMVGSRVWKGMVARRCRPGTRRARETCIDSSSAMRGRPGARPDRYNRTRSPGLVA
eukprot:6110313-Prymnesium_polylepis.1